MCRSKKYPYPPPPCKVIGNSDMEDGTHLGNASRNSKKWVFLVVAEIIVHALLVSYCVLVWALLVF